jgi:hypothetical protein
MKMADWFPPRSDIYALGLILYEMFTGAATFSGDTPAALIAKHISETPKPPRTLEPTLPIHIEGAILKCLEKEPVRRFQSVRELQAALLEGEEVISHAAPPKATGSRVIEEKERPSRGLFGWPPNVWAVLGVVVLASSLVIVLPEFFPSKPNQPAVTKDVPAEAETRPSPEKSVATTGIPTEAQVPTPKSIPAGTGGEEPQKAPERRTVSEKPAASAPVSPLAMLAGNYTGTWKSKTLEDVSGIATMTVTVEGDAVHADIFLTGGEVSKDSLTGRAMKLGENVWRVEFKAKWAQLRATGIFKDERFDGDYTYYSTPEFADRGTWNLRKVAKTKN